MLTFSNSGANDLYDAIRDLPIVSPHGHCDPVWFSKNKPFKDAAELLVIPDHYVFRMLYSQGVSLQALGVPPLGRDTDPRDVFRTFAKNWHLFLGTPSRIWISHVLEQTLKIDIQLRAETADLVFDEIARKLATPNFQPRALFDRFNIEVLATTDSAVDDLAQHRQIAKSDWPGRVVPTFRPDSVIDPLHPNFRESVRALANITGEDTETYDGLIAALRQRRMAFKDAGATATDHAADVIMTEVLANPVAAYRRILSDPNETEARAFYGHMLVMMAEMSVEDGLVMQLHVGSKRNTNADVFNTFGADKGADIPRSISWVTGLDALLNRVGNHPAFRLILFTLDESTYARELAPMAGHWPCLRIGPPWWFHDSPAGIARYFDQVVETAGYWNLAGFNDDTRAFMSIPARHDLWRRGVAEHLSAQVTRGYFDRSTAEKIARHLAVDAAREAYRL